MEKLLKSLAFSVSLLALSACSNQFCSLNCQTPQTKVPLVKNSDIQSFAEQGVLLYPKGQTLKIVIPTDKFFRPGTPTLKANKLDTMHDISDILKTYGPQATVEILGYTDTTASTEESRQQSVAKAESVAAYLWAQGLDAEHLYAIGLGKTHLVGDPNDLVANSANRRVEIIVKPHCTTCF